MPLVSAIARGPALQPSPAPPRRSRTRKQQRTQESRRRRAYGEYVHDRRQVQPRRVAAIGTQTSSSDVGSSSMLSRSRSVVLLVVVIAAVCVSVALPGSAANSSAPSMREPGVRDCSTSAYGDLGSEWRKRAILAGPVAFVEMRDGTRHVPAAPRGRSWPLKVLVVVEPRKGATVTIAARSRSVASLAYDQESLRRVAADAGGHVPLSAGAPSVRLEACARPHVGKPWNRGTQFPGYFLVSGRRCIAVTVRVVEGPPAVLRRTLRFGRTRC